MYRSWAYILMVVATLAGVVALLWPSPAVRTIGEIAMVPAPRSAPVRPEPPAKAPKAAAKPASRPAPAPPAVLKRVPPQNTTTRRAAPVIPNGLQPNMFGRSASEGVTVGTPPPGAPPPPRPGAAATARPIPPAPPPAAAGDPSGAVQGR